MSCNRPLTLPTVLLYVIAILLGGCDKKVEVIPPQQLETPQPTEGQIIKDLISKAEHGDVAAQLELGKRYTDGDIIEKDANKGFEWLEKASKQGNQEAEYLIGRAYSKGKGVERDLKKAFLIYLRLNDKAYPAGMGALGVAYLLGEGTEKDVDKGLRLLQRAAALGDPKSQSNLGVTYALGTVVERNDQLAVSWYKKSVAQGNASAQLLLGYANYLGNGTPKNIALAFELYTKAATQGDEVAQRLLAGMYENGEGASKDSVLAYAWSNIAAASGDAEAINFRNTLESKLSKADKDEAERLSATWRKGFVLKREKWESIGEAKDLSQGNTTSIKKTSTGTAFVVSKDGKAITNHHVVDNCTELRVQGHDGLAKFVTDDKINDLALLQIQVSVPDVAPLIAEPAKLRQGEDIIVYGFPLNSLLSSGGNLTPGVISALTGLGNNTNQIQITAPIQLGSSGSPVLNKKGEVIGVVSMKLDDTKMAKATGQIGQNVNFAVSGQTLKAFLDTNKVSYTSGSGFFSREKSTADIADEARKWTVVIECWK